MEEQQPKAIAEKINWISSEQPVFSIDVHPDNSRFLTCSDELINIWKATSYINSTKPSGDTAITETELSSSVATIKTESDFCIQKIGGNTNCARFSPDGKFIAANSDDFSVSVYKVSKANTDKESWKRIKHFKTHTSDVLSIAWSGDSRYLASCSIDNSVVVYDMRAKNVGDIVLKSSDHNEFVKGVTFDPIGKYLVSQSDHSVFIWALNDGVFQFHKRISNVFGKVDIAVYKPSFSPCGQFLIIPNAYTKTVYCANIYMRQDDFSQCIPFHNNHPVWFTAFNPCIFKKKAKPWTFFAVSTEDTISVFSSEIPKPMIHINNICKQSISDIVWSADGLSLLVSSNDGSVHSITFPSGFFGNPLSQREKKEYLEQYYGDMELGTVLSEYPSTIFAIPQLGEIAPLPQLQSNPLASLATSSSSNNVIPPKPKPSVTQRTEIVNGKKRIVPVHTSFDDDEEEEENTLKNFATGPFNIDTQKENMLNDVISNRIGVNAVETSIGFAPSTYSTSDILKVTTEVTKKRTRIEPEDNSKKNKKKTKNPINPLRDLSTITAEPLYLRLNARDELFCSLEGIVELKRNNALEWKSTVSGTGSVLHSYPNLAAGTQFFIAVCTFPSNQCHVFSTESGMRLLPPLVLDSKIEHVNCSGDFLAAYTAELMFYVWDVRKQKCLVRCSADPLLSNTSITSVEMRIVDDIAVTAKGVGIVTLTSGESFAFDVNLNTWICVADSHSVFSPFLSQGRVNLEEIEDVNFEDAEVTLKVLRNKAAKAVQKFRLEHPEITPTTETANIDIIDDLELAMTSAAAIGDIGSYMYAVQSYAKHLAKINNNRLTDLFRSLLGPWDPKSTSTNWNPLIAGTPKRLILQHLVTMLSSSPDLLIKRICSDFANLLAEINK